MLTIPRRLSDFQLQRHLLLSSRTTTLQGAHDMQLNNAQLSEFDEELPPVVSNKGDIAHYKVNHKSKQVWIKTGENDGNAHEWRHTNGGYDALMKRIGRNTAGEQLGDVPVQKPIEAVDPFSRKSKSSKKDLDD